MCVWYFILIRISCYKISIIPTLLQTLLNGGCQHKQRYLYINYLQVHIFTKTGAIEEAESKIKGELFPKCFFFQTGLKGDKKVNKYENAINLMTGPNCVQLSTAGSTHSMLQPLGYQIKLLLAVSKMN